jgi:hypothetical protein
VNWNDTTGEQSEEHLLFSTNVRVVRTPLILQKYLSKYIAKEFEVSEGIAGRLWGKSENLDTRPFVHRTLRRYHALIVRRRLLNFIAEKSEFGAHLREIYENLADEYGQFSITLVGVGWNTDSKMLSSLIDEALIEDVDMRLDFEDRHADLDKIEF